MRTRLFSRRDPQLEQLGRERADQERRLQLWVESNGEYLAAEKEAVLKIGELATQLLRPHPEGFKAEVTHDG